MGTLTYAIVNFGCRVNHADALAMEADLIARGGRPVAAERADVILVNSCSVTASADQGTRQSIRRLHRDNPSARILVTGCYATRAADEVGALPGVTHVIPNDHKDTLPGAAVDGAGSSMVDDWPGGILGAPLGERGADGDGACGVAIEPGLAGRTAWTLRVQTGCEEACSFCIIPRTRGASRSRPIDDVRRDVDDAVARGFKEIAIAGVHLGSWGRDLPATWPASRGARPAREADAGATPGYAIRQGDGVTLVDLLRALESHGAPVRYRVSSLEPMDCTDDVIDTLAASSCFAPHLHLPLQHASNRLLQAMRRPYTLEAFDRVVTRAAAVIPGIAIGTDVIVGFPGERDEEADALASYLADAPLSHVHVFPYSDRPGTEASRMGDRVHGSIVRERGLRLRAVSQALRDRFATSQVGTRHRALTLEDGSIAVTGNYQKVSVPAVHPRNVWVDVEITSPGCARFV